MRALAISILFCGCATTRATTDSGVVVGRAQGNVREFLGIPFAAPPVGALRWKPPGPVASWSAPRVATKRGAACAQPFEGFARETSEDCLTLNIWAPEGEKLPVLVWIHGGAFYMGSGDDDLYDGARLAARTHAIVVTINYRLGAFGFLSHREFAREMGVKIAPSLGLLDQRAALAWVQRNIGAFGGDVARVTIFGSSAGGWSVCSHLASPGSRGLFSRAIIQSGACSDALYFDGAAAEAQGDALAAAVGCTGEGVIDCLRKKSADALAKALPYKRGLLLPPGVWWGPVVDGVELPKLPLAALRAGEFARVPLMIGWNRDEGTLHTMRYKEVTAGELEGFARDVFGPAAAARVPARYARATPKDSLTDVVTDGIFACNSRRVARVAAGAGLPVFLYEYNHALDLPSAHALGATHSLELFFLFGNRSAGIGLSAREQPMANAMMDAWGRFARDGDPGGGWPRYTANADQNFVWDLTPSTGAHLKQSECDFWDELDGLRQVQP